MKPQPRARIAKSFSDLIPKLRADVVYDVVIVGSGYGGSVAAQALAGQYVTDENGKTKMLKVCVLERGREFLPGEFPSTFGDLPGELRVGRQSTGEVSGHEGLFDVRLGDDVNALVANGLGGGSLINAGVMLEPRLDDFDSPLWRQLLVDLKTQDYFQAARRRLGAEVLRDQAWSENSILRLSEANRPAKTRALASLGAGKPTTFPPITVALEDASNDAGTSLNACNQCGDCMTGCNEGSKDSLDANLLVSAKDAGCEIYTGATVLSLKRISSRGTPSTAASSALEGQPSTESNADDAGTAKHWILRLAHTDPRLQGREENAFFLRAKKVILAAGALGSPEILLRSRGDDLAFSPTLGSGFSCNGDNIAAVQGFPTGVNGCADEDVPCDRRCVGPTITAAVELDAVKSDGTPRPFLLQEFSVPGPLKRLFEEIVTTAATIATLPDGDDTAHDPTQRDPLAVSPAAMARTLLVGMVGHDDAKGRLRLSRPMRPISGVPQMGAISIDWPSARHGRELDSAYAAVCALAENEARVPPQKVVANPMWRLLPPGLEALVSQPRGPVLTVHPLGGCGIGFAGIAEGVVDANGAVFDGGADADDHWEGSLLVLDGSIIPGSLGVNPSLTIAALAMHAMAHWCGAWKLLKKDDGSAPAEKLPTSREPLLVATPSPCRPLDTPFIPPRKTEVEIVERLRGMVNLPKFGGEVLLELTLAYSPAPLQQLVGQERKPVKVDPAQSRVRVYSREAWLDNHLMAATDLQRKPYIEFEAALAGALRFLHREETAWGGRVWSGLKAWLLNRGTRDLWDQYLGRHDAKRTKGAAAPVATNAAAGSCWSRFVRKVKEFTRLASRAGEVRLFAYDLKIGQVFIDKRGFGKLVQASPAITGDKRLTYSRRANPWWQLTHLRLTDFPTLAPGSNPWLELDARFLANQGFPLLRIVHQRNHAEALAELMSFGLYLTRVMISIHLWTFRKPDTPLEREPVRLPGDIAGLPTPEILDLVVDKWPNDSPHPGQPLSIRLTRYPQKVDGNLPPLVMIHGYSVSGNTFTHPALAPSAAGYFWQQGRDVWVVELRTSAGLASATYAWAMEQAGLIDIPAALMHVYIATGRKKIDVLAHCLGCAMLSMAILTDARSVRASRTELGVNTWLTSEHLGMLTAFNGANPQGDKHPVINRIILSQKGPVLRYTDANIFRGFALQYVRRWFLTNDYQFRPSKDPGVAEQLLDRFLASLPYPDSDYDVANPIWPCARTPWTATRHRMDALYGRDFNADNMSPEVLEAIDDLFGPINMDTVSQTIHFTRFSAITNQRGRGEFVTRGRLQDRWGGIPTLAIHGRDNGLVDAHTQVLLEKVLRNTSGVPFVSHVFDNMGHQDVLLGKGRERVFEYVEQFLLGRIPTPIVPPPERTRYAPPAEPWIGPRIEMAGVDAPVRIACMSRPDQGDATLWLVPVFRMTGAAGAQAPYLYQVIRLPEAVSRGDEGGSNRWLLATPELDRLGGVPTPAGAEIGWLAVFIYLLEETTAHRSAFLPPTPANGAPSAAQSETPPVRMARDSAGDATTEPARAIAREIARATASDRADSTASVDAKPITPLDGFIFPGYEYSSHLWKLDPSILEKLTHLGLPLTKDATLQRDMALYILEFVAVWLTTAPVETVDMCFVRLADLQRAQVLASGPSSTRPLKVMVGSCQYPYGLVDKQPASASLQLLGTRLNYVDLALMVGDQIYADATAGLVDAVRRDELYDQPNERALRLPAMRQVLRRVSTRMLLDDHELFDNWELLPAGLNTGRFRGAKKRILDARTRGVDAYLRYQRVNGRRRSPGNSRPIDLEFQWGGHPFLMLDTRTERRRGAAASGVEDHIIDADQRARLEKWLSHHQTAVKFIATPSLLLPRRKEVARSALDACRSDAWDGFPDSLSWLLNFIVTNDIRNTVFVSGDEHHSLWTEIWLGPQRLKVVSVHSSALYAPFPFANGKQADLVAHETTGAYGVECEIKTTFAEAGDGFAVMEVCASPGNPSIRVEFLKSNGTPSVPIDISLVN